MPFNVKQMVVIFMWRCLQKICTTWPSRRFFGGISRLNAEAEEHVDGGTSRFDKKGIIYQSLCGGCRQNGVYPTTPGAWSRTMPSPNCNNAMFKIDFENLNQQALNESLTSLRLLRMINIDLPLLASSRSRSVRHGEDLQAKFRKFALLS